MYEIQPIEQVSILEYKYIDVSIADVILGVSATVITTFYDGKNVAYKKEVAVMEGEDYKQWGTDDDYILQWVVKKYNLTLINSNIET
jgi:hypothetical protein